MKLLNLAFLAGITLSSSMACYALQTPIDCNFFFNGSDGVEVAWTAYPGKGYQFQITTHLPEPSRVNNLLKHDN